MLTYQLVEVSGFKPLAPPRDNIDDAWRDAFAHDVAYKGRDRRPILKDGYMLKQAEISQQDMASGKVETKLRHTLVNYDKLFRSATKTNATSMVMLFASRFPNVDWKNICLRSKIENGVTTIWVEEKTK